MENGWVLNFIQGTTTPGAKGRIGAAQMVKDCKPLVIPIVIKNFNECFHNKKPLPFGLIGKGYKPSITFKKPLKINYDDDPEKILEQMMQAIEQLPSNHKKTKTLFLEKKQTDTANEYLLH